MFIILLFMFSGIISGYALRKWKFAHINPIIITLVWMLLFMLGIEVGLNDHVVNQFPKLGLEALMIALFGTLGSVIGAWILWRMINKNKKLNTDSH